MFAVYIRVSTSGQNIAGQKAEIERWLAGHNIVDAKFFIDKASGTTLKRPQFEAMQKAIFMGEVETVVVWKLDRLSRNMRDGLNTLADWLERGVRFVSVTQQFDFSGTVGKLLASVFLAVAEMEMETRRERQAAGIAEAKKTGTYTGRKPATTKANPVRALELREQGLQVSEIATSLGVSERTTQRYLNG